MLDADKLSAFVAMAPGDWRIERFIERCTARTYEEFVTILYKDLDNLISEMQLSKNFLHDKSEDDITMGLVQSLNQLMYRASHDPMKNGHVDFFVDGRQPDFHWMGEAKVDSGPTTLEGGMRQLCDRYSTGGYGQSHGGVLVYIKGEKAALIFRNWREHVAQINDPGSFEELNVSECPCNESPFRFQTTHIHSSSGLPYTVRHMGIHLHHKPTDRVST